jgi:hypothetical protein
MTRLLLLAIALSACGGEDGPVPATPLAGELNGTPWMAGAATASRSDPGEMAIRIDPDAAFTCGSSFGDAPYIGVLTPWTTGYHPIGLESEAAVFIYMDETVHLVLDGRIELDATPLEPGAVTSLRLRASFQDDDDDLFVEGAVQVQICE